jgi:hypothetical protein
MVHVSDDDRHQVNLKNADNGHHPLLNIMLPGSTHLRIQLWIISGVPIRCAMDLHAIAHRNLTPCTIREFRPSRLPIFPQTPRRPFRLNFDFIVHHNY